MGSGGMNGLLADAGEAWMHGRLVETLGWVLVHSVWEAAGVAALVGLMMWWLRRGNANARYVAGYAGILLMVALPVATFFYVLPPETVGREIAPIGTAYFEIGHTPAVASDAVTGGTVALPRETARNWREEVVQAVRPCLPWAVAGYFLGMLLLGVRLMAGYLRLRGVVRQATPVFGAALERLGILARRMEIGKKLRLLESAAVEVPALLGAIKPVILLPAAALTGRSTEQLSALLAHELAHIRRHDYFFNLVQSLAEVLLFYHPAMWWLAARVRQEREHCCDDLAVTATDDRVGYARALATMESLRLPGGVALAAGGGRLLPRIERILAGPRHARQPRRLLTTTMGAMVVMVVGAMVYVGCNQTTVTQMTPLGEKLTGMTAGTGPIEVDMKVIYVPTKTLQEALKEGAVTLSPAAAGAKGVTSQAAFAAKDSEAVARLIAAMRKDAGTSVISSPSVRLASGMTASIEMTNQQNYVKGYSKKPGKDGAPEDVTLDVETLKTGLQVGVKATMDGGKIVTQVHPKLTTLDGIDTVFDDDFRKDETGKPVAFKQVPLTTVMECEATGTVEDGGLLLLLGPTRMSQAEVVKKVPGLSELPAVGGLFTDRSYVKVEYTLVMVVQPTTKVLEEAFGDVVHVTGGAEPSKAAGTLRLAAETLPAAGTGESPRVIYEARVLEVSSQFLDDFRIGWNSSVERGGGKAKLDANVIDNWTLSLLLQAAQADAKTAVATAPRLVTDGLHSVSLEYGDIQLKAAAEISADGKTITINVRDATAPAGPMMRAASLRVSLPTGGTLLIGGEAEVPWELDGARALAVDGTTLEAKQVMFRKKVLILLRPTVEKAAETKPAATGGH